MADLVRRVRKDKGFSHQKVADNSGGGISKGYVGQIENRHVLGHSVTPQKLIALAKGLRVPEEDIMAVAFGRPSEPMTAERFFAELQALGVEDFNPAKGMNALTPTDMEEILAVVRSTAITMVEQKIKAKKKK